MGGGLREFLSVLIVVGGIMGILCSSSSSSSCNKNDLEALMSFKSGIREDESGTIKNWIGDDCCKWRGIYCSNVTGRVTEINWLGDDPPYESSMTGFLSPNISRLSFLEVLYLDGLTNLEGHIPTQIGNLSKLRSLSLFGNQFDGPIPSSIGMLSNLELLSLHDNKFTGSIPSSIGNLKNLIRMDIHSNRLTGTIPDSLTSLRKLTSLDLSNNFLTGNIPERIGNMQDLEYIDLSNNSLSGNIPLSITNLTSLYYIIFNSNRLSGSIPSSIGGITELLKLILDNNRLQGSIPWSLGDLKNLTEVQLGANQLSGELTIPYMSQLNILNISHNKFHGILPKESITSLKQLYTLDLSFNNFNMSSIPSWIGDLQLFDLYLAGCGIQGEIPQFLQRLPIGLGMLDLSANNFTGSIPDWMGKFSNLYTLNLSFNSLSSKVPYTFTKLQNIDLIDLHSNNLSGPLDWLFHIRSLHNDSMMSYIDVSHNSFSGGINDIGILGLQLGFKYVNFSHNFLNGSLPNSIANLDEMVTLDLSNNHLTSHLPPLLSNATKLQTLELQNNRFSGRIPDDYLKLKDLKALNVSYNLLDGKIPEGKPLVDFPTSSYAGNRGLCGKPLNKCTTN